MLSIILLGMVLTLGLVEIVLILKIFKIMKLLFYSKKHMPSTPNIKPILNVKKKPKVNTDSKIIERQPLNDKITFY